MTKKKNPYVMTTKLKSGAVAPSGGVVKTDRNGKPVKKVKQ